MSNEENTKEVTVEEIAEKLAEGLEEETVEETSVEEISEDTSVEEETSVEETPTEEETSAEETTTEEETSVEETTTEEETSEETPAEEAPVEEVAVEETVTEVVPENTKKKINKKVIAIIVAAVVVLAGLVGAYFAISAHYQEHLFMQTSVNGIDCSGKTIEEVEAVLQKQVEEYVLTISGLNGTSEQIKGTDIDVKYIGYNQIKEAFAEQNPYLWPEGLFEANDIDAEIVFEYSKEKLDTLIGQLSCLKAENQTAPVSATVVYKDGEFVIQDEVYGTQLDATKVKEAAHATVLAMESFLDLDTAGCYVQPQFKKDSAEVIAAKDEMNKYLTASVTYSLDGVEVTVDKDEIAPWISVGADMKPVISSSLVKKFTNTLGAKYNTPNKAGVLTTPKGKTVTIPNAVFGRQVGSQAECNQLISEIKAGKTVKRAPIFSQTATPEGQLMWGSTYAEVDITEQHMWFVKDGNVVFECDVVTGVPNPQRATPTGAFKILEKMQNKVLRGNIMPNGKREYETPVKYWARVTWSGIGFHDATWQAAFGGTRYKDGYGSHGCINMPLAAVKTFYSLVYVGCPVVIHN